MKKRPPEQFLLSGGDSDSSALLSPFEVYRILVDHLLVEDEGPWNTMTTDRRRPFEGLTMELLGLLRTNLDDFTEGIEIRADDEVLFLGKRSIWSEQDLYGLLKESPFLNYGNWPLVPIEIKLGVHDAWVAIGELLKKRFGQALEELGYNEKGKPNVLPKGKLDALFGGYEFRLPGKKPWSPEFRTPGRRYPRSKPAPAPSPARTKRVDIKVGDRFFTAKKDREDRHFAGEDVIEVEVIGVIPPNKNSNVTRYMVQSIKSYNTLDQLRTARELHTTRGPW